MASINFKYFHLICAIFILFGINISKVIASDCDAFANIIPYINSDYFKEKAEKELNCCYLSDFVKCDGNDNITEIILESLEITNFKKVMEQFIPMEKLTRIEMKYLTLDTTELPSEIGNLIHLKQLRINYSKIKDISNGLTNLKSLEDLDLSDNKIKSIPSSIFELSSLTSLDLSNNAISGSIPAEFTKLKNLNTLKLGKNQLEGYIPYEIIEMTNLFELDLMSNEKLKGYVPPMSGLKLCEYGGTNLCTLKGDTCRAPIQCYKEEIIDSNNHNGNPDPNMYLDRAITSKRDRNVQPGNKYMNIILGVLMIVTIIAACYCAYRCCCVVVPGNATVKISYH